ncbi:MAG: sigma-70 family RNA polymerase sigma factor [Candidatus Hydrogenedentes bacterium]|nr:sigma-70 family RNA polymerase sigma factor [Candidatus Hydrogenedentota bacterium]
MTELNDQSLLAHWYRHRNAEAFRVLATRHARMVYATALRILRNAHDAEEVAQQSFLALAQTRRPPSGNVAAWLHRTAYRAALNLTRARTRRTARDHAYATAQPDSTRTEWDDIRDLVDEAVAGLPDACRECIVLYFFEEQTHAAIGERLGITRQAVAQRIEKGITLVRKRLASKGIVAPAGAALVALIHENSALALPATLTMELGRIALAGTPSLWAVGATFVSGFGLKVAAAVLVVGVAMTVATIESRTDDDSTQPPPGGVVHSASTELAASEPYVKPIAVAGPGENNSGVAAPESLETAAGLVSNSQLASVSGVVLLPDKTPMPGARITLVDAASVSSAPYVRKIYLQADDSGRFEAKDLTPAEYLIIVGDALSNSWSLSDEMARVVLAAGERRGDLEVTYRLEGDFSIAGIVADSSGSPLSGVEVMLAGGVMREAVSDERGRFELTYVPEGQYNVVLSPTIMGFNESWIAASAGDEDVRFVLQYAGGVSGRVIDGRTHKPIPKFEVAHMRGHKTEFNDRKVRFKREFNDADGLFSFENFQSGEGTVVVRAPGYEPALAPVTVPEKELLSGLTFELTPVTSTVIAGKVVTEDGKPVAGAKIYTEKPEQPRIREHQKVVSESDESGAFTVADALPGQEKVYAWHSGFVPAAGETSDGYTIVLKPACRLTVDVYSGGVPLVNTRVSAGSLGYGATDSAGRVVMEELPPGELSVSASLDIGRTRRETVVLEQDMENTLRIEMASAPASVEGTVHENGGPVGAGTVHLFVETATGMETLTRPVLPGGDFRFPEVPLGAAQLVVTTAQPRRRVSVEDVALNTGKITNVNVDVTIEAWVRGTVNGLARGKHASVNILRGAIGEEEALELAAGSMDDIKTAGQAIVKSGAYEVALVESGTHTVLLLVHPGIILNEYESFECRVVEVPDGGEINVDFALPE